MRHQTACMLSKFLPFGLTSTTPRASFLSLLPALHPQNLDHTDEDIQKVKREGNTLVDWIARHQTSLGQASMMKNLLGIVESEAWKSVSYCHAHSDTS